MHKDILLDRTQRMTRKLTLIRHISRSWAPMLRPQNTRIMASRTPCRLKSLVLQSWNLGLFSTGNAGTLMWIDTNLINSQCIGWYDCRRSRKFQDSLRCHHLSPYVRIKDLLIISNQPFRNIRGCWDGCSTCISWLLEKISVDENGWSYPLRSHHPDWHCRRPCCENILQPRQHNSLYRQRSIKFPQCRYSCV